MTDHPTRPEENRMHENETVFRAKRALMRALCAVRRHAFWERESMLMALAFGRSRRCRWCNRLVVKREHRATSQRAGVSS